MKLSSFIFDLLKEIKKIDREKYIPVGNRWHNPILNKNICYACLAGMYAAAVKWVPFNMSLMPVIPEDAEPAVDIDRKQKETIDAIDWIRLGRWNRAVLRLNDTLPSSAQMALIPAGERPRAPVMSRFNGWEEFDQHIESLHDRATQLQDHGF